MKFAILYESRSGHTAEVADRIVDRIKREGHDVTVIRCREAAASDSLNGVDAVIIGGSIRAGRHHPKMIRFVKQQLATLKALPGAFFLVCLTARADTEKAKTEVQGYLKDFNDRTGWKPNLIQPMAGALHYRRYNPFLRVLMKKIVGSQGNNDAGGESQTATDTSRDHVFTDWEEVQRFADAAVALARRDDGA